MPVAEVVAPSDIAIDQPNILPSQAMGLGNGRIGAALWAANGLTVQLNRKVFRINTLSPNGHTLAARPAKSRD